MVQLGVGPFTRLAVHGPEAVNELRANFGLGDKRRCASREQAGYLGKKIRCDDGRRLEKNAIRRIVQPKNKERRAEVLM